MHFSVCVHMSVCLCTYVFAQETRKGYWPGVAVTKLEFKSGGQGLGHLSPWSGPCPTFYINPFTHLLLIWFRDYVHPHLHVSPLWALVKLCSFTPGKYSCSSFIKVQRPRNPECGEDLPICLSSLCTLNCNCQLDDCVAPNHKLWDRAYSGMNFILPAQKGARHRDAQ